MPPCSRTEARIAAWNSSRWSTGELLTALGARIPTTKLLRDKSDVRLGLPQALVKSPGAKRLKVNLRRASGNKVRDLAARRGSAAHPHMAMAERKPRILRARRGTDHR